jgi:membrane-associated phospholipid phosphatase
MIDKTARLVSYVLNPFPVAFAIVLIICAEAASGEAAAALKWAAISLALSVLPVLVIAVYLVRRRRLDGISEVPHRQRTMIYAAACVLGAAGCLVLWAVGAPRLLLTSFAAGFITVFTFMVINIFWKISVHTGFVAAATTTLTIVYGIAGVPALLLVPLIAWARLRLGRHTPAQVAAGALFSGGIVTAVFWLRGMLMG